MAIVIGEARIRPCPIMFGGPLGLALGGLDAAEVRREAEVVVDAHAERGGGVEEVEVLRAGPRSVMKAVLQELASAVRNGIRPSPADG